MNNQVLFTVYLRELPARSLIYLKNYMTPIFTVSSLKGYLYCDRTGYQIAESVI